MSDQGAIFIRHPPKRELPITEVGCEEMTMMPKVAVRRHDGGRCSLAQLAQISGMGI